MKMFRAPILIVLIILIGCATTPIGKAVQTADIQKQIVEASAVEFAKLYINSKITNDVYVKGKVAYEKWSKGETALAKSLADWKRIGDAPSGERLTTAMQLSGDLFRAYVDAVGQWVDLNAIQKKITGGK